MFIQQELQRFITAADISYFTEDHGRIGFQSFVRLPEAGEWAFVGELAATATEAEQAAALEALQWLCADTSGLIFDGQLLLDGEACSEDQSSSSTN